MTERTEGVEAVAQWLEDDATDYENSIFEGGDDTLVVSNEIVRATIEGERKAATTIRALRSERDEAQGELGFALNDLRTARDRASRAEAALSRKEAALREMRDAFDARDQQWHEALLRHVGSTLGRRVITEVGVAKIVAIDALASEPGHEGACQWKADEDGIYDTGCGNRFFFDSGTVTENEGRFCFYCGRALLAVEPGQEGGEDG